MEFKERRVDKEVQWPEQLKEWMVTTKGRHRSIKRTLKLHMLKAARIATGLGNKWDHQRTESLNILIKEAAIYEVLESQAVKQPVTKYVKDIYNMGKYRLAPEFQAFLVSPLAWSQKTPQATTTTCRKSPQGSPEFTFNS